MINLNEIAFIDTDGFDYNDGEWRADIFLI